MHFKNSKAIRVACQNIGFQIKPCKKWGYLYYKHFHFELSIILPWINDALNSNVNPNWYKALHISYLNQFLASSLSPMWVLICLMVSGIVTLERDVKEYTAGQMFIWIIFFLPKYRWLNPAVYLMLLNIRCRKNCQCD